jgi:hypothetical protein
MRHRYVFVLGRAGCGKSALYREMEKRMLGSGTAKTLERVDDFPRFWAAFKNDDAREREGRERIYSERTDDGDYIVTNDAIWNDTLKQTNAIVLGIDRPDHVVFIEFARPSYTEAIQHFDDRILSNCLVIFMEVSFETCWARNLARHAAAMAEGADDHMVSREEMEASFLHDDQDAFVAYLRDRGVPVSVVNNEADGEEHLVRQVARLFEEL